MTDEEKRPESENEASEDSSGGESVAEKSETVDNVASEAVQSDAAGGLAGADASNGESSGSAHDPDETPTEEAVAAMKAEASAQVATVHDHGHDDDHFAHVLPMPLLLGVLGALILLTVLTVGVTAVDLGGQGNFVVAMIIATVKAALVMGYFMHMVWDSKFNVVAFTSSFLFVLLFLAMSVLDRSEYRDNVDRWESDQRVEALQ